MTAKGYGTTFEVFREDNEQISENVIVSFYKQIFLKLKDNKKEL